MIKIEKNLIKNENGISLVTLVITVILLVIITGTLATNSYRSLQLSNLTRLQNDIEALNDRVASYFVQNGKLPIIESNSYTKQDLRKTLNDMSMNDGDTYYEIDMSLLDNISLNNNDIYVINEETHVIYYLKGINYEGKEYHTVGANPAVT